MRPALFPTLGLTVSAALVLSACSGGGGDTSADGESTIRVAVARMAAGIDPVDDNSSPFLRSYGAGEALAKVQADGSVAPELAESLERTSDTEWTIELREGVQFWSGAPVDADAVVAALDRSRGSALGAGLLDGVTLTAVDADTVVASTEAPSPYLDEALANYALTIHNTESYPEGASAADLANADLTGPFRITDFQTERSVTLEANDTWWGGDVAADRVEVQLVPDPQSRAEIALTGQADVVSEVPGPRVAEIEATGSTVSSFPGATTAAVYLNPASPAAPALADVQVREALAWAVDRESLVELATDGLSVPSPSWLASNPAFPDAAEEGFTSYDPERAAELLDAAGWPLGADGVRSRDGQPLSFRLLTFGVEVPSAEVLQAQWAEIGVQAQVQTVESTVIGQVTATGDWDAFTQAWTTLGNVPARLATQIGPDGAANHGDYTPPAVPALLEQAVVGDEAARDEAVYALNEVILAEVPLIPLHPRVLATALAPGLTGFVDHPLQYENLVQPGMRVD